MVDLLFGQTGDAQFVENLPHARDLLLIGKSRIGIGRSDASTYSDPTLSDQQKIARVREVFDKLGVARLTEQQINHRFERALNTLDTLSVQSEGTARLREYAGSLIGRNK